MGRSRLRVRDGVRAVHPAIRAEPQSQRSALRPAIPCSMWLRAVAEPHSPWPSKVCGSLRSTHRHAWSTASLARAAERGARDRGTNHGWSGTAVRRRNLRCVRCRSWASSCFRIAERGLAEMRRVVRPGGRVSVVTWTQPQNYELAAELRAAIQSVWPEQPPAPLPAQLRYREESDFRALFKAAGLGEPVITTS